MIPLFKVYVPKNAADKLKSVLASGYIAEGEDVKEFERKLREYLRNENIITVNSCTGGLQIALRLANVQAGDEVLTTSMTCIATNSPIVTLGAKPVWVDVDPKHGMISPKALVAAIKAHPNAKAVVYVCWGGDLGPLPEIDAICKKYKIRLIVDSAQAFGIHYGYSSGRSILGDGTHGDIICFSFQAIKHLTTGDGGAMAFRYKEDLEHAVKLKWFGLDRDGFRTSSGEIDWEADVPEIGFKMHMNNIAGCIGCAQMDDNITPRLFRYLLNDLKLIESLNGLLKRSWNGPTSAWVSTFLCDDPIGLLDFLKEKGIHTSQLHVNNDVYSGFHADPADLPGVKEFMKRHICLPCGWWISDDNIQYMVTCIKKFYVR